MAYITIDEQQAQMVRETSETIEVRDHEGNRLGYVSRNFTPEEIAEAKRRLVSGGPSYTTQQVLSHLSSLEAK
jgi:hypothetical protein